MKQVVPLVLIAAACLALGVYLHANLLNVVIGLVIGGGVGGGLLYLVRRLGPGRDPGDQ